MSEALSQGSRWPVVWVIARREAAAAMRGAGVYAAMSIAIAVATWILLVNVRALQAGGLLVLANPFAPPFIIAMLVLSLYLAVSAAVSAARDRSGGTLEVLFYGPVDEWTYILGKIGGLLLAYLASLPLLYAAFALLAWLTGFSLNIEIALSLLLSIGPVGEIISFGILLSIGTNRVRTAVLLLTGVILILFGITLAYSLVLLIPLEDPASPLLPLRDVLATLETGVRWVSPFAYLEGLIGAAVDGAWPIVLRNLAISLACTGLMVGAGAWWLRHRGVHHRGEL